LPNEKASVNSYQLGKLQKKRAIFIFFSLILIVLSGFYLRCESALKTEVIKPLRADAGQYFMYAYNLRHKHIYSQQVGNPENLESPVKPDAVRSPGYPLFLSLLVNDLPTKKMINLILFSQVIISTLTILFTFLLFEKILCPLWSLGIALLVALSPHLIVSNSYILTETLFCFLLVALGWLISLFGKRQSFWLGICIGAIMGIAALVRPSLQFFPLILSLFLILQYGWKKGFRFSLIIMLGFAFTFLPWIARNMITLDTTTDKRLMINFLHHGMYPNFMHDGLTESYGFPYRYDPRSEEVSESTSTVLKEISKRFNQQLFDHFRWFILDKPRAYWAWDMVQGAGDVFVYPVRKSPYFETGYFKWSHQLMFTLHWPLLMLATFGCSMAWFPLSRVGLNDTAIFVVRFCALILIYYTLIHMIGVPFPRYSVPLRPILYGMALFTPYILIRSIQKKWAPRCLSRRNQKG
jgi:hypothetical protein